MINLRTASLSDRLSAKTTKSGDCLLWTGRCSKDGYGLFSVKGRSVLTHRAAYMAHTGIDPGELCVCHTCDRPACVNPAHLFLGTQSDNMADMKRKGRGRESKGENNIRAKLTAAQVLEIRSQFSAGMDSRVIAAHHGIYRSSVYKIAKRETWRHV